MSLVTRVERLLQTEQLFQEGECIVVAVSGGPDSVALLHLLFALSQRWSWRLVVAHLNHGFRGKESEAEALFVADWAGKLGLPCEIAHLDVPQYIRDTGKNPQTASRELRYRFLHETALQYGAVRIATAHQADDQAETLLMRLLRGTGPAGLSGIPMRRMEKEVELVRPLLRIYKSELLEYCHLHHLTYFTDSSNLETKYFRNEIRLDLLPILKKYNDQLPQSLNRLSDMMTVEHDYMEGQTRVIFEEGVSKGSDSCQWSRKWFMQLHVALQRRLIKLILNYLAFEADSMDFLKLEHMRDAILGDESSNLSLHIGGNLVFTREYDRIYLHNDVVPSLPYDYAIELDQQCLTIQETGAMLKCMWLERDPQLTDGILPNLGRNTAWFDAEQLLFPLKVRNRRDGDRIYLLGLDGTKKVKDIFIDAKIPPSVRLQIPVLTDDQDNILWLPGVRRSKHALVTAQTTRILCLELHI
jgi:tRNA(Ile)-lysidine synthase